MAGVGVHWADKAIAEMERNARKFEHNAQSYLDLARVSPRIAVGRGGVSHPKRHYQTLSRTFASIAEVIRDDMKIVERHRP